LTVKRPPRETGVVPRATDLVREFKDSREFKNGWYYRLADGHPWIGPFMTEHIAGQAREHVTSSVREVAAKPWLKISESVALGRLYLTPPRGGPAFKTPSTTHHTATVPASSPVQIDGYGYQARPRLALSARREAPAVRDERAASPSVMVPRRRGSRTII